MSSSPTKTTPFRRVLFAAAPLVVLLLVWPATHAYADIFSVFKDCFTTVTNLLEAPPRPSTAPVTSRLSS